jgi:hypothetical protein
LDDIRSLRVIIPKDCLQNGCIEGRDGRLEKIRVVVCIPLSKDRDRDKNTSLGWINPIKD